MTALRDSSARLNIEHLRKQAKVLLRNIRAANPDSLLLLRSLHPNPPAVIQLADSQLVIARAQGFPSWPKLKAYVSSITGEKSSRYRAIEPELAYYEDRASGLLSQHASGLDSAALQIRSSHPRFYGKTASEILAADFTIAGARLVTAREHGHTSWKSLERWVTEIGSGTTIEPFHQAFLAVRNRDIDSLNQWLDRDPSLVSARGTNGNSLLNLAMSVRNVNAARLLVAKSADVNAANVRGWTPLHQAACGIETQPVEWLLESGADTRLEALGDGGTPLAIALFWGNAAVADLLARDSVLPMNLRTAAGAGRIDLVEGFFGSDGTLIPEAGEHRGFYRPHSGFPVWRPSPVPREILDEAFVYAAKNGRIEVLAALLSRGAQINADPYRGTALHWASYKGNSSTVQWLIENGADINLKATFGGPEHGEGVTALHLAAQVANLAMGDLLLREGADPKICDDLHQSDSIGWADFFGHKEMAELLRRSRPH